eukprot:GSA120T00006950001.1
MPRAARPRILELLLKIFVNNFDPNLEREILGVAFSAVDHVETRNKDEIPNANAINRSNSSTATTRTTSSRQKHFLDIQSCDGIHKENEKAAEILQRHFLLLRFFAGIPSDLQQVVIENRVNTSERIMSQEGAAQLKTASSTSSTLCFAEFDEVCRSLWFFLLQEEDEKRNFLSRDSEFHAISSFEDTIALTLKRLGEGEDVLVMDNHVHDQQFAGPQEKDPEHQADFSPSQRNLSRKRLQEVNRLIAKQVNCRAMPESRTLILGLIRIMLLNTTKLTLLFDQSSYFLKNSLTGRNELAPIQDATMKSTMLIGQGYRILAQQRQLIRSSLRRLAEVLEDFYRKSYLPKALVQTAVLMFSYLEKEGLLSCFSSSSYYSGGVKNGNMHGPTGVRA